MPSGNIAILVEKIQDGAVIEHHFALLVYSQYTVGHAADEAGQPLAFQCQFAGLLFSLSAVFGRIHCALLCHKRHQLPAYPAVGQN